MIDDDLKNEFAAIKKDISNLPDKCKVERVGLYIMVFLAMIGGCNAEREIASQSQGIRERMIELKVKFETLQNTVDRMADREAHVERKEP